MSKILFYQIVLIVRMSVLFGLMIIGVHYEKEGRDTLVGVL